MAQLTNAQCEALDKCKEILREHFEAALLVVTAESDDNGEIPNVQYHGGYMLAKGMATYSVEYLSIGNNATKRNNEETNT